MRMMIAERASILWHDRHPWSVGQSVVVQWIKWNESQTVCVHGNFFRFKKIFENHPEWWMWTEIPIYHNYRTLLVLSGFTLNRAHKIFGKMFCIWYFSNYSDSQFLLVFNFFSTYFYWFFASQHFCGYPPNYVFYSFILNTEDWFQNSSNILT